MCITKQHENLQEVHGVVSCWSECANTNIKTQVCFDISEDATIAHVLSKLLMTIYSFCKLDTL